MSVEDRHGIPAGIDVVTIPLHQPSRTEREWLENEAVVVEAERVELDPAYYPPGQNFLIFRAVSTF